MDGVSTSAFGEEALCDSAHLGPRLKGPTWAADPAMPKARADETKLKKLSDLKNDWAAFPGTPKPAQASCDKTACADGWLQVLITSTRNAPRALLLEVLRLALRRCNER